MVSSGAIFENGAKARLETSTCDHINRRLTNDEVREEALKDIRTLAARLSKINFIASDSLTMYDFTVSAHIASILFWRTDNWLAPLFREKEIFYHYLAKVAEAVGGFDFELMEQ